MDLVSTMDVRSIADCVFNHQYFMEESFHPCRMFKLREGGFLERQKNLDATSESWLC